MSLRFDRRGLTVLAVTGLLAAAAIVVTIVVGEYPVPLDEIIPALLGRGPREYRLAVQTFRAPRVLVAAFAGASLGMSGAIFQSITQNPLVTPDIVGVNTGASLTVVISVVVFGGGPPPGPLAFGGALAVAVVVYLLSLGSRSSRFQMVLIGIGVNATLGSVILYLITRATLVEVQKINLYLVGDVSQATWSDVRQMLPAAVALLAVATALGPVLQVLQLGDDVAASVGGRVHISRLALVVVGVGLAAIAVAAAGPIGFVSFISPHIARGLARTSGAVHLPVSAAVGATLVVIADYAAHRLFEPTQLPVGIFTVIIGGPYFVRLLLRSARAGLIG